MDPRPDRRRTDLDKAGGLSDRDDRVIVLGPNAVGGGTSDEEAMTARLLTRRPPPGLDLVKRGGNFIAAKEVGGTQFSNRADVTASDPLSHCRLLYMEEVGNVGACDLGLAAQLGSGIVVVPVTTVLSRGPTAWTRVEFWSGSQRSWSKCRRWRAHRLRPTPAGNRRRRWCSWRWKVSAKHGFGNDAQV